MTKLSAPKCLPEPGFEQIPEIKLRFDIGPEIISELCQEIIDTSNFFISELLNLSIEACTFEKVLFELAQLENWRSTYYQVCVFPQYVSQDKEVVEASVKAAQRLDAFEIELGMREDLYHLLKKVEQSEKNLQGEDLRLMQKTMLAYKRIGMELDAENKALLKTKFTRLSELCIEFSKNIGDDNTSLFFEKKDLEGLPEDFIENLQKSTTEGTEKYKLTMKYPDVYPTLDYAKVPETRKKVEYTFGARCSKNVELLEEALKLRLEIANILGYKTHAEYGLELKMAKNTEAVKEFLDNLKEKLSPIGLKELKLLLEYKKEEVHDAKEMYSYDINYYKRIYSERKFSFDDNKLKDYFPIDHVTRSMLDIYQTVLGLVFTQIKDPQPWVKDESLVSLFEVKDSSSKKIMGYFYLDLFPREFKYSHAACFPIQPAYDNGNSYQLPVAAMVANFSKAGNGKPSLLRHSEVVTYFHELGHVMHNICSMTKYSRFQGTNVEGDFVEAPSQMLENWCWDRETLKRLSSHYETKESLSDELCDSLIKSKNSCVGIFNLRQLFFGFFDMEIHSISNCSDQRIDTTKIYNELRRKVTFVSGQEGTFPQATFGHMMGGYDAGYYGYLWSQVYSADMFYSKFKTQRTIINPEIGMQYRNMVLAPGGSRDAMNYLVDFIGRAPNSDAFIHDILGE